MAINTKTNEHLLKLIADLKKKSYDEKVNTWSAVAEDLSSPTRKSRIVNLYKLSLYVNDNETALVPGKVLGSGEMTKKMTVAAYSFSKQALDKINKAGKAITIQELMAKNPKAEKVRIVG